MRNSNGWVTLAPLEFKPLIPVGEATELPYFEGWQMFYRAVKELTWC